MSRCSTCKNEVVWVVTAGGKRMPLDPDPVENGNIIKTGKMIDTDRGAAELVAYVHPPSLFDQDVHDGERYVSHFATCANAEQHRRSRDGASRAALDTVDLSKQQTAVLLDLLDRQPGGATAHELATSETRIVKMRPGISANQVASRLGELRDKGLVEHPCDENGPIKRMAASSPAHVHTCTVVGVGHALDVLLEDDDEGSQ